MALAPLYQPGRNLVRDIFPRCHGQCAVPDRTEIAAQTSAALRAEADLRDPATAGLIAELRADDRFRTLRDSHDVRPTRSETKRFDHPAEGSWRSRRQSLAIVGTADQAIITHQGSPSSATAEALAKLS